MDYSSTSDFDSNPFANEGGFGGTHEQSTLSPSPVYPPDDGFHEDHIGTRLPDTAVIGLFGGEDNSPAGGLFGDIQHASLETTGGGSVSNSGHATEPAGEAAPAPVEEQPQLSTVDRRQPHPQQPPQNPASPAQHHRDHPQHHKHDHSHQQHSLPQHRRQEGRQLQPQRSVSQYRLQVKVTALERLGRKDPVIRFDVYTNLTRFHTTQFRDVRRTHPEFVKLAEHLISNNPECFIPAVPPPSTSAGVGTDEDDARVRGLMQRWLNYVCGNEVLMRDEEMVFFVESDSGYSPVVRKKQPATGVRRRVIKQFAPPPDGTPELADTRPIVKAFYLGTMETAHKVDKVVKTRRGLGLAEADLGVKLYNLSNIEPHTGMANALRKLGKTIQQVGDYHAAQATSEATTLGDPLQYHSSDACIVKETLTNRQIIQRELQQAQSNTKSKESTVTHLRARSNIRKEKSDEAITALDEARQIEEVLTQKFTRVTSNLVLERRRWFHRTSMDLRASVRDYVLRQIEAERRLLSTLESVRPDIRAVDSSGGLSRLGRDAPPASRRASIAASQGPRGDAWSGAPRSAASMRSSLVVPVLEGASPVNGGGVEGMGEKKKCGATLPGIDEAVGGMADEEDRLDAKNAASRLATSTF